MKNLITKEEKDQIDNICKDYQIVNYSINPDGSIDVDGKVDIEFMNRDLFKLPLKFNKVSGDFYCSDHELTSLSGSPRIVGGNFYCSDNNLTSLVGGPVTVGGNFYCRYNQLTSLEGSPTTVGKHFTFTGNHLLSTLEGAPHTIGGDFSAVDIELSSTYSGNIDIEIGGDCFIILNKSLQLLDDNIEHIKLILKYQRHFYIWNDDMTLNDENFQLLLDEIKDGLL
jgi:hypothetical protein